LTVQLKTAATAAATALRSVGRTSYTPN